MRFRKSRPDPLRFPRIDRSIIEDLGGIDRRPAACLVAAWLAGGCTLDEKRVVTPSGEVVLPPGRAWGSVPSMQEDILAAVGQRFSYGDLRGAAKVLVSAGVVTRRYDPLPHTRGRYGTVFELSPALASPTTPISATRMFVHRFYGNPDDFRYAACVTGVLDTGRARRRVEDADAFINRIGDGFDKPAFTNIGRWRSGEVHAPGAPVFVPYFTIDIDRNYLSEAWEDAQTIAQRIADAGFSPRLTRVSFSGRRGFHLQIDAREVGSPIFRDTEAARMASDELSARLCYGVQIDPSVNSPNQLIRVAGSRHDGSGLYKVTWTLNDFQGLDFEAAMEMAREVQPTPRRLAVAETDPDAFDFFDAVSEDTEARYTALRAKVASNGGPGETIRTILAGVTEGETWHPNHEGRNKAAFILACWFLEDRPVGDPDIERALVTEGPEAALYVWNERNSPPLPARELDQCLRSASRRVRTPI